MLINDQNCPSLKANSGIDCEVVNMITITYDRYSAGGWSLRMEKSQWCWKGSQGSIKKLVFLHLLESFRSAVAVGPELESWLCAMLQPLVGSSKSKRALEAPISKGLVGASTSHQKTWAIFLEDPIRSFWGRRCGKHNSCLRSLQTTSSLGFRCALPTARSCKDRLQHQHIPNLNPRLTTLMCK